MLRSLSFGLSAPPYFRLEARWEEIVMFIQHIRAIESRMIDNQKSKGPDAKTNKMTKNNYGKMYIMRA